MRISARGEADSSPANHSEDSTRRRQESCYGDNNVQLRSVSAAEAAAAAAAAAAGNSAAAADERRDADEDAADDRQLPAVPVPMERWKTLLALAATVGGMLMAAAGIATVHERVPDSPPLPDIALKLVANISWALNACEVLLLLNITIALTVTLLHRHRWVVLRRELFLVGLIFAYRAVTMTVTVLPTPNWRNVCLPKSNASLSLAETVLRVGRVAMWAGFTVGNERYLCGDYIFSGHTASLTLSYLAIRQYSPPSARPLHWISLLLSLISFIFLLLSHGHYTVDIILGYWLASRLWLILHALADTPHGSRRGSHFASVWWFPIFSFLEANVPSQLPNEMELPWRRGCFRLAYQRLDSFRMRLRNFVG